jgi:hypothetical protein
VLDGADVGSVDGIPDGALVGDSLGTLLGDSLGTLLGNLDGAVVGKFECSLPDWWCSEREFSVKLFVIVELNNGKRSDNPERADVKRRAIFIRTRCSEKKNTISSILSGRVF